MLKYSWGNLKVPKTTLIINMSSAEECPAKDQCPFSRGSGVEGKDGKCYALKAERQYPLVRAARKAQTEYWRSHTNEPSVLLYQVYEKTSKALCCVPSLHHFMPMPCRFQGLLHSVFMENILVIMPWT